MNKCLIFLKIFLIFFLFQIITIKSWSEEESLDIAQQVEILKKDIHTFNVRFNDNEYDESKEALSISKCSPLNLYL